MFGSREWFSCRRCSELLVMEGKVLAFPGVMRGALDVRAKEINLEMMIAAAEGIAKQLKQ